MPIPVPQEVPGDAGLQPQRTGLAWIRTAFVMPAVGLLGLRAGLVAQSWLFYLASVPLLAMSCLSMLWAGKRLYPAPLDGASASAMARRAVAATALAVLLSGLLVLAALASGR